MPKASKSNKKPLEQEEVQDIMAWGNRRQNYYQQSEEEYSQSGEEEAEAQKLYEHQLEQLGHEDLYQLPQDGLAPGEGPEEDEQEQGTAGSMLSRQYLTKQISRMAKLGLRISEEADSKVRRALEVQIQAYMMALIGLRELSIPYIQYHPLFNKTIELKQDINKLKRLLYSSTLHDETNLEESEGQSLDDQEDLDEEEDHLEQQESEEASEEVHPKKRKGNRASEAELEKGLQIYQQTKKKQDELKAALKQQKRKQREANKKPAFLQVKDQEGRLASEKILKNKGLIKKRKKIDRNSRVKLRRKFDKAASKRRAYGHVIRENPGRQYQGETNIRYGRIASIKLK